MPANTYNLPLIRAVRDKVRFEPSRHSQASWGKVGAVTASKSVVRHEAHRNYVEVVCPTTACVAGHTAILAGAQMLICENDIREAISCGDRYVYSAFSWTPDNRMVATSEYAREQLGMDYEETMHLFGGDTTKARVLEILDTLIKDGENAQAQ